MRHAKKTLLALSLLALSVLPCIGVFALIFGRTIVNEVQVRQAFRIYPGATEISATHLYECCDSGLKLFYYWTLDSDSDVRQYYKTFALPFINNRTMYHPYGGDLQLGVVPYPITPEDEIDLRVDRECHFSQKYTCIQVQVIGFDKNEVVSLPTLPIMNRATVPPPQNPQEGGTLIIYGYYAETDFNPLY